MSEDFSIQISVEYFNKDGIAVNAGWYNLPLTEEELSATLKEKFPDYNGEYTIDDFNCDMDEYNQELYNIGDLDSWNRLYHFINDNYWENGYDVFECAYLNSGNTSLDSIIDDAEGIMNSGFVFYNYKKIGGSDYLDLAYYIAHEGGFSRDELLDFVDYSELGDYISDDVVATENGFIHVNN